MLRIQTLFALLLPLTALEGVERSKMFNDNGIEVMVLDKRIDFTGKRLVGLIHLGFVKIC